MRDELTKLKKEIKEIYEEKERLEKTGICLRCPVLEEEIRRIKQNLATSNAQHFNLAVNDDTVPKDQYDQMIKNAEETVKKVGVAAQAWKNDRDEMAKKFEAAK